MSVFLEINTVPAPGDNVSSVENEVYRSKTRTEPNRGTGVTVVACFRLCISYLKNRDLTWFPSYLMEYKSFKPDFLQS